MTSKRKQPVGSHLASFLHPSSVGMRHKQGFRKQHHCQLIQSGFQQEKMKGRKQKKKNTGTSEHSDFRSSPDRDQNKRRRKSKRGRNTRTLQDIRCRPKKPLETQGPPPLQTHFIFPLQTSARLHARRNLEKSTLFEERLWTVGFSEKLVRRERTQDGKLFQKASRTTKTLQPFAALRHKMHQFRHLQMTRIFSLLGSNRG